MVRQAKPRVKPSKNQPVAGERFGKLVVIQRVADKNTKTANLKVQVRVECDCGNRLTIPYWYLVRPHSKPKTACGKCEPQSLVAQNAYTHRSWYMMNYRCTMPNHEAYESYGGRGIKVCERWSWDHPDQEGFKNFLEDMGPRPQGMSLDRIRNQGHYQPSNCKWSTAAEQRANQSREGDLDPDPDC